MKFSVLLSVYKKEEPEYLKQSLESIIDQTRKPDQIVIVKDGKLTQELDSIIKYYYDKYPKIIKIYGYEENRGLGYALQKGVQQCDYEYIARMDSDDIAIKERFEIQMNYLENHSDIDILGGYVQEYDEKMQTKIAIRKVPLSNGEIYKKIGRQCPFNHSTVILKKTAVIQAGNYEPQPIEDYRLWIQMCLNKCKMANISEVLVNFRTSKKMYQRRSGLKYLHEVKKVEKLLLKYKFINFYQYIENVALRTILAIIPSEIKKYVCPKIVRKY